MAALRSLGSALVRRARPVIARSSFRQPQRNHRLTPSDDEHLQKTTLHRLERESPNIMFIENYTNYGFSINGNTVVGPCAILPQAILQWNVGTYKDIIPESLSLFFMLEPKIEIVVLGTGTKVERLDPDVLKCLQQHGIAVEVQSTLEQINQWNNLPPEVVNPATLEVFKKSLDNHLSEMPNACATFNFLVSERRVTAAGLIPPPPAAMSE